MSEGLIGLPDLASLTREDQMHALAVPMLMRQKYMGTVETFLLSDLEVVTDTVGVTVTTNKGSGYLRVSTNGDVLQYSLVIGSMTTVGGTCTALKFRLPNGLKGFTRNSKGNYTDGILTAGACVLFENAGYRLGLMYIQAQSIVVLNPTVAGFLIAAGTVGLYGSGWSEVLSPEEIVR